MKTPAIASAISVREDWAIFRSQYEPALFNNVMGSLGRLFLRREFSNYTRVNAALQVPTSAPIALGGSQRNKRVVKRLIVLEVLNSREENAKVGSPTRAKPPPDGGV